MPTSEALFTVADVPVEGVDACTVVLTQVVCTRPVVLAFSPKKAKATLTAVHTTLQQHTRATVEAGLRQRARVVLLAPEVVVAFCADAMHSSVIRLLTVAVVEASLPVRVARHFHLADFPLKLDRTLTVELISVGVHALAAMLARVLSTGVEALADGAVEAPCARARVGEAVVREAGAAVQTRRPGTGVRALTTVAESSRRTVAPEGAVG